MLFNFEFYIVTQMCNKRIFNMHIKTQFLVQSLLAGALLMGVGVTMSPRSTVSVHIRKKSHLVSDGDWFGKKC